MTSDEQKAVKTTAFYLQLNPANPGMSFHKLDKVKDKNFWSVRASGDAAEVATTPAPSADELAVLRELHARTKRAHGDHA